MCLGRIRKKRRMKLSRVRCTSVNMNDIRMQRNSLSERSDLKDRVDLKEARLKILVNPPGRCRCMHLEESASDGGGGGEGCRRRWHGGKGLNKKRWEGRGPSLARRRNTCSGCVHAFQGFRESGEYDGGDVSLNIWRGRDFKRTRVTALGRRLNNAKSTYSPACRPAPSPSFFLSFRSFFVSLCLSLSFSLCVFQPGFPPAPMPSLLRFSLSRSHRISVARSSSLQSARTVSIRQFFFPPFSLSLAFSIHFYSVTYCIIVLYFVSNV